MAPMLSIDFGNTYTKVGLRADENSLTKPIQDGSLTYDPDGMCIPTLAACRTVHGKEEWLYGLDVLKAQGTENIHIFRNWKPKFFEGVEQFLVGNPSASVDPGQERSFWDGLTNEQLSKFLNFGGPTEDQRREASTVLARREQKRSSPSELSANTREMARGFFRWLRDFVDPHCKRKKLGSVDSIPVRIMIPSFGVNTANATLILNEILSATGWNMAEVDPVLAEPVANMIGTLSEGRNWVWRGDDKRQFAPTTSLGHMFRESALLRVLRDQSQLSPIYRVMIVDLGGYTLDFAIVGFDMDSFEIVDENTGLKDRIKRNFSQPLGVHGLDQRIREVLSAPNQQGFDRMMNDVDSTMIDRFHMRVYQEMSMYRLAGGVIGEETGEKTRIRETVAGFADDVAEVTKTFLQREQVAQVDELILTGGGCNIPLVRDAIRKTLQPLNLRNSYIPTDGIAVSPAGTKALSRVLVRGATALGGASVFFDYQ